MVIFTGSLVADLLGILSAVVVAFYTYFKWSYQYWKRKNVPYLEPVVPLGNFQNPYNRPSSFADETEELYRRSKAKGGKYCGLYNMAKRNLLVTDLDILKHILTPDFSHFADRGAYTNEKDDPLGAHLFALSGTKWRNLRAKLTPTFTSGKLKGMFQTLVDRGLALEDYITELITTSEAVDIKDIMARFTTDIIGSCAFGLDCNSFKEPNSPFKIYGKRFFSPTKYEILRRAFCTNFPNLARSLGTIITPRDVSNFYMNIVKDAIAYREKNHVVRKDFMQLLLDLKNNKEELQNGYEGDGKTLTLNELAAQSFVFFIAGFETSSTTATFVLFELASHPEIQDKVRHEINTVLAKHDNKMTYESLSELKYMKQVIDEALRKYPPVASVTRQCNADYKVPGEDLVIEKGVTVFIPIRGIHYDEENYKDPEVFDPERFSEENKKNRHHYAHIPFGEGPRICIGERFGIMQTKVGLTSLLRRFKVKLNPKTNLPLRLSKNSLVTSAEGDVWLSLEKV